MAENTREIVLDTLLELEKSDIFSHQLIKAVLDKYNYIGGQEKGFIKRVTEGTIERQIELDYYLNFFSSVPVRKMKPLIRNLLRMSTYQLLYMDAVPDSAICNEACKLAQKRKFHNLKGFVNGVLRNIAKNKDSLPMPDKTKEPQKFYSVRYSMPEWLVEFWLKEYGNEITATLLEGLLEIHPVSLRVRSFLSETEREELCEQLKNAGVELVQSEYLPYLYTAKRLENVAELPGFAEGDFTIQDVSSVLAVEAAGIENNHLVMDICAAPGGKTILASEMAEKVISRDVSDTKVDIIEENLDRLQVNNVITQVHDATQMDDTYVEKADVLIMDVPCSGLGIMGKKRDIKYHASLEGLESIVKLQKEIIRNSWQYVKPGGFLLYSTCTINPEENEKMVDWILKELPFEPDSLEGHVPERLMEQKRRVDKLRGREDNHTIQLLPGYMESDGFFFARLRRRSE